MKFAQWCAFAALLAAAALLWNLREVLIELFGSIVLAVALCSLVGALQKRLGWKRWQALFLGLGLVLGLALVLVAVLVPPFVQQFAELIRQLPQAAATLGQLANGSLHRISQMIYGQNDLPEGWLQSVTQPSDWGVGRGLGQLLGLAGNLSGGFLHLLFVLAVAVMVSAQPHSYREVAISLLPSFSRRRCRQVLDLCGQALSSWMVGVLISSVCVSLLAFIGLSLLGVKLTMANALLAGLLNVIPNVGPTLGTVFPMAVALLENPWKPLAVLLLYVVIQNLESYVITPSVMHHQLKLLPGLTLAAQVIFTVIFGPVGLLLALPLAVCLQVIFRELLIHDLLDGWKRPRWP
jgi:predicted PurR-regulated permease PerM